jgi:hypothetical protein
VSERTDTLRGIANSRHASRWRLAQHDSQANWVRGAVVGQTGVLCSQWCGTSEQASLFAPLPPASLAVGADRRVASAGGTHNETACAAQNTDYRPQYRRRNSPVCLILSPRRGQEPGSRGIAHEA